MLTLHNVAQFFVAFVLPGLFLLYWYFPSALSARTEPPTAEPKSAEEKPKSIMQPAAVDLLPPKDDPFTVEQLKEFDGQTAGKPIYVAIKGTIFDVTRKADVYGAGGSYNVFAGKDGSKGLGMSSLKPEDAVSDFSGLDEKDRKVLDDWHAFFEKRYNIVGRVVEAPAASL
ncbi:cytochrome b5 [Mycena floridula]|nr:cytochrome b5 [Mycena floridula]